MVRTKIILVVVFSLLLPRLAWSMQNDNGENDSRPEFMNNSVNGELVQPQQIIPTPPAQPLAQSLDEQIRLVAQVLTNLKQRNTDQSAN